VIEEPLPIGSGRPDPVPDVREVDGWVHSSLPTEVRIGEGDVVRVLESEREAWGAQASRLLAGKEFARRPELQGLTLLLIAGVQYLLVRSRSIRIFGGLDIRSDAGWAELKTAVREMALALVR